MIKGPADLSIFRDDPDDWKNYTDPLPACPLELNPGIAHPGVSTIKSVDPKSGLMMWVAKEVALSAYAHRTALVDMEQDAAVDLLSRAADRKRDSAAERGHVIHDAMERLIEGLPLSIGLDIPHDADAYLNTLRRIVADLKPVIVAAEVVMFGDGYAGTFDAIWKIDGHNVIVDYKSRKPGKAATRDAMEGAQLGAYSLGRYWIAEDDTGIHRIAPLDIDGAMLLSIAPDGYCAYAVDLDQARTHWRSVHTWWQAQKGATAMFGRGKTVKVLPPDPSTPDDLVPALEASLALVGAPLVDPAVFARIIGERTTWMLNRIDAVKATPGALAMFAADWPDTIAKPAAVRNGQSMWSGDDIDELVRRADDTEGRFKIPFGVPDPTIDVTPKRAAKAAKATTTKKRSTSTDWSAPEQFTPASDDTDGMLAGAECVDALRAELLLMPSDQRDLVIAWAADAAKHGVAFGMGDADATPLRNFMCASVAVAIARAGGNAVLPDAAKYPSLGVAIGVLSTEQCQDVLDQLTPANAA